MLAEERKSIDPLHALDVVSSKLEDIANRICRAQYDDTVTMDDMIALEAEFDRLHDEAGTWLKALFIESVTRGDIEDNRPARIQQEM